MAKQIPVEQLVILHNQLNAHQPRDSGRKALVEEFSTTFGVTPSTVYRQLRKYVDFSHNKRKDFSRPRVISSNELSTPIY